MNYEEKLKAIIRKDNCFMDALKSVQRLNLPSWCIGAGIVRNIVWAELHGYKVKGHKDIDVAFFDAGGTLEEEKVIEDRLAMMDDRYPWDVKNQALVHLWYEEKFGCEVEALHSLEDAVATWPETAVCIGVWLDAEDELHIIAPYGVSDLFDMVLRRNPKRVTKSMFEERLKKKSLEEKWPLMTIIRD